MLSLMFKTAMKLDRGREWDRNVQRKTGYPIKLDMGKEQDKMYKAKLDNTLNWIWKRIG